MIVFLSNFCQAVFKFHFSKNFAMVFVRGDARVHGNRKWQIDQTVDTNLIPKWIFKARFKRRTLHVPNLIPIWVDPNN